MAILAFQKPEKVIMLENDDKFGRFEFRPLEPGYGITIGNALRRILINSLEGFAITSIKIDGVQHEFATIPGVIDDVTQIILNLKQVRFKQTAVGVDSEVVNLHITGKNQIVAGDFNKVMHSFEVLNPDLVICNMNEDVKFNMTFTINKGRGYVRADENEEQDQDVNTIAIDSIYTPIVNVKFDIENYRVAQKTDYEKLILEITTDGSILPKDALKEAAKILIYHFMLFSDEKITMDESEKASGDEFDEETMRTRKLLQTKLSEMDLSVRALNCLKAADVETLGELVTYHRNDLLKFRNFGKKSLNELDDLLTNLGLSFGMDTSKFKFDKE
ncbi:MAG: DNA-directed RNA polymerase subunit alpha [Marinilabiliaceae bacterium]|nr:DNA-directed RNA polymerase subunit alpha [Bacteroidales bacterium]MDD5815783.1 DNA-directed RNA polymerase subunit alpha [Bacteroidales bacterium]MDY4521742.1 DNA-directed RNA polymerase subunit alpha [Bacteroidales bacterium]